MQSTETTGKTVAEATEAAAKKLGVTAGELTVTVLEETKGLFGKSTVRIRAEIAGGQAPAQPAQEEKPAAKESKPAAKGRGKKVAEPEPASEAEPKAETVAAAEEPASKPSRRGKKKEEPVAEPASAAEVTEEQAPETLATEEDAANIVALVDDLMAKAELQVSVKFTELSGRYVTIELDGKDAAYLVGKQGEVLNATQYLINIIAGRRFNNGVRANLDGNNYREKREAKLEMMATELAKQVKARGEEAVLDALPAFERRIVHKVLATVEGITTYSEGEEPNRRVVIAPID